MKTMTNTQRLRAQRRWNVSDEEIKNLKSGKCWCGIPRTDFDSGQRIYCSKKHTDDWHERTAYWNTLRDEFLSEHGKFCDECGLNEKKQEKLNEQNEKKFRQTIKEKYPQVIEQERVSRLDRIEDDYKNALDDDYITKHLTAWELEKYGIELKEPRREWIELDVDHVIAIANGGDVFDKKNLQILCKDCHNKKTKQDMIGMRKNNKNQSSLTFDLEGSP